MCNLAVSNHFHFLAKIHPISKLDLFCPTNEKTSACWVGYEARVVFSYMIIDTVVKFRCGVVEVKLKTWKGQSL